MKVNNSAEIRRRIDELKRRKRAVILAHYYTTPEVQEAADFLGDSLALSVKAQSVDADIILFAGVHFMAETAKVLCPDKKVLIPCPKRDVRWPSRAMRRILRSSRRNIPAIRSFRTSIPRSASRP